MPQEPHLPLTGFLVRLIYLLHLRAPEGLFLCRGCFLVQEAHAGGGKVIEPSTGPVAVDVGDESRSITPLSG